MHMSKNAQILPPVSETHSHKGPSTNHYYEQKHSSVL